MTLTAVHAIESQGKEGILPYGQRSLYLSSRHFYQPPRENPWIEEIEQQDSAAPFHDWNERIHYECYHPNSRARALDAKGKIVEIVNNFERTSFNFGPHFFPGLRPSIPTPTGAFFTRTARAARRGVVTAMPLPRSITT